MKYAFPIFQYCRGIIYFLTSARRVIRIMTKIRYKAPNNSFSSLLFPPPPPSFCIQEENVNTNYIKETQFRPVIFYISIYIWQTFPSDSENRSAVDRYNTRNNICIVDINQGPPRQYARTEIRLGPRVRMKKDFVAVAHFSLGLEKPLRSIRRENSQKMFRFQIAFPSR